MARANQKLSKAQPRDSAATGGKRASPAAKKPPLPDNLGEIPTDGRVYQTPGEVRKALRRTLCMYSASVSVLARLAGEPYQGFNNFMKARGGDFDGENLRAYKPAAYLAERIRIVEKKPKTKKRKALEAETRAGSEPFLGVNPKKVWLATPEENLRLVKDSLGRYSLEWDEYRSGGLVVVSNHPTKRLFVVGVGQQATVRHASIVRLQASAKYLQRDTC